MKKLLHISIDNKELQVESGTTVLQAATQLGIEIPTMCFHPSYSNRPSCMVCLVKDIPTGKLLPSCALPVADGMKISASDADVLEARKEALELLLSDHVGDCEAPCRLTCPAFMDIPNMNRLIAANRFEDALKKVREEIALPLILGYVCPAPCEKACRRAQIDQAVSICWLKRFTAQDVERIVTNLLVNVEKSNKKIAIIGTGPGGLAAAFYLLRLGHSCTLFDKADKAGGALRFHIPEEQLPREMLDLEIEIIHKMGASFRLGKEITQEVFDKEIHEQFDAIILATGSHDKDFFKKLNLTHDKTGLKINKSTHETEVEGVFALGNIVRQQQMAVRAVGQGRITAFSVHEFLAGRKPTGEHERFNSAFGKLMEPEFDEYLKESNTNKRLEPINGYIVGFSPEEAVKEAKRCLHCDCRKMENCKLRNHSDTYQANRKRFLGPERKQLQKHFQHENIVYEPEKCIRCGLCVEITQAEKENFGLTFIGRGFDVRITVPFNKEISEGLIKTGIACADACPTGALSIKN